MEVYAQQNDNLDAILYRYFGRSEGLLEIAVSYTHLTLPTNSRV